MENLIQDIHFGLRSLIKHRAFAAIAIITLALGVGANSTIFSVVNATLMRSLPVSHPESLVYVFNGNPGSVFSYPDYAEVRDQNHVFDGLIGFGGITVSLNSNDQTDLVNGAIVTGNYFQVLGVGAQKGRVIAQEDDKATHLLLGVFGSRGIKLLDQTGQAVTDLPCEDHGDRVTTVLSYKAVLLACLGAGHVRGMERAGDVFPRLGT